MTLSEAHVLQFQLIYKKQFAIELSKEEAYEKGMKVLRMMQLVYRPMTRKELNTVLENKKALFTKYPLQRTP